ncbi:hypothetical protein TraAM80_07146 [Trypanosoma rangeli]|uniref:Uncharacterized protein n=1 Tax=Trypanosoma rangeli TaxID=5698 RepID=A0A422N6V1_TRYRA|nr:uncharacterized protein TraAM80_07146 [Trypanosoma rangeli]RNF01208.1 hypothetical protein TraAM80_07146 [Trypanosoma rangeli]|eukprot:RNF01208.1 hypothetical protein TraAM80_07146 [Trypanosoma rangeli]
MDAALHTVAPKAPPPSQQQQRQSYATFGRLLRSMQEAPARSRVCGAAEAAIPVDEPLATNSALLEQLGVMDLSERRTHAFAAFTAPTENTKAINTALATRITEACRVGVACHLPPTVILRKIASAMAKAEGNTEEIPPVAAAILLRSAAERITSRSAVLQRRKNGCDAVPPRQDAEAWPRSDQGEVARLQWALYEEIRRGYEVLTRLPQGCQEVADTQTGEQHENGRMQGAVKWQTGYVDELRARLELAVALQDGAVAVDLAERLFAAYDMAQHRGVCEEEHEKLRTYLLRDVCAAISAFHAGRNFTAGCGLYEKVISMLPVAVETASIAAGNSIGLDTDNGRRSEATEMELAERLRLLSALANCVDANAAHFTYVRDAVVKLFANTDVGYLPATRQTSRECLCAALHALSRIVLEPRVRMGEAQSLFCAIQQNSHADVSLASEVTEALLQVSSAALDNSVALMLYNQLAAPQTHRAELPANAMAVLVAEEDALDGFARFLSFVGLRRRVMASSAAHLLAAKLLLQRKPSEVVYTVLDLIHARHEVEPQRTFFLRLLAFYRDLQQRMPSDEPAAPAPHLHSYTQRILADWREALCRTGVRTLAFTTLRLLQHIRRHLVKLMTLQKDSAERKEEEAIASLLAFIESTLLEFSLGWLNHCATASRTPRYHLTVAQLRRWGVGQTNQPTEASHTGVIVKRLRYAVTPPETVIANSVRERRVLVRKAWEALCSADEEGRKAVLGFSDFVRLCWLEDGSLFGSNAVTTTPGAAACVEERYFSLDALNSRAPLVYVTDALGETILHDDPQASSSSAVVHRDVCINVAHCEPLRSQYGRSTEEEWLAQWLEEACAVVPVGRGVFEDQLERLLRITTLMEGKQGAEDGSRKTSVLQCFVSVA